MLALTEQPAEPSGSHILLILAGAFIRRVIRDYMRLSVLPRDTMTCRLEWNYWLSDQQAATLSSHRDMMIYLLFFFFAWFSDVTQYFIKKYFTELSHWKYSDFVFVIVCVHCRKPASVTARPVHQMKHWQAQVSDKGQLMSRYISFMDPRLTLELSATHVLNVFSRQKRMSLCCNKWWEENGVKMSPVKCINLQSFELPFLISQSKEKIKMHIQLKTDLNLRN